MVTRQICTRWPFFLPFTYARQHNAKRKTNYCQIESTKLCLLIRHQISAIVNEILWKNTPVGQSWGDIHSNPLTQSLFQGKEICHPISHALLLCCRTSLPGIRALCVGISCWFLFCFKASTDGFTGSVSTEKKATLCGCFNFGEQQSVFYWKHAIWITFSFILQ